MKPERSLDRLRVYASKHNNIRKYWADSLQELESSPLFFQKPGSVKQTRIEKFELNDELFNSISSVASNDGSLVVLLLTTLRTLLYKYTGERKRAIATSIPGVHKVEKPVNEVMPVVSTLNEKESFKSNLLRQRDDFQAAIQNADFPIEIIEEDYREHSTSKLLSIGLNVRNIQDPRLLDNLDLDIHFTFVRMQDSITGELSYNTSRCSEFHVKRMIGHFTTLISSAMANPERSLSGLSILTQEELNLNAQFNSTANSLPPKTVLQSWEEQAAISPDKIAISSGETSWTFNRLKEEVNKATNHFAGLGVIRNDVVAISLKRGPALIQALLAAWKNGATFLLIDPSLPDERVKYMLENSGAKIFVCEPARVGKFCDQCLETSIDALPENLKSADTNVEPADVAYLLYTSGSTGLPKGVKISHASLYNYIQWASRQYILKDNIVFPLHTSISFDLTLTSIFLPLVSGGTIAAFNGGDGEILVTQIFRDTRFDVIKVTPSHLRVIRDFDDAWFEKFRGHCPVFIVGGEDLPAGLALSIYNKFQGNVKIFNEYGPTEATVGCMIYDYHPGRNDHTSVPIGVPIDNTNILLLDRDLNVVPTGVKGDLYIGGAGLTSGYLPSERTTQSPFIDNPFEAGTLLYKSGDVAMCMEDGNLVYLGRKDKQMKVRGFRVDAGEVEYFIRQFPSVKDAVVLLMTDAGDTSLCAYYISSESIDHNDLLTYLSKHIAAHAIPNKFTRLEKFPLTSNGKLDTEKLSDYAYETSNYKGPKNEREQIVAGIWTQILGIEKISVDENLFLLGADSIKALQFGHKVRGFGYTVSVGDVFRCKTIEKLAIELNTTTDESTTDEQSGAVVMTPIQRWFFSNQLVEQDHFCQSVRLDFKEAVSENLLRGVFDVIVQHHDALRMTFTVKPDQSIEQQQHSPGWLPVFIRTVDKPSDFETAIAREKETIDLANGPLMKLVLLEQANTTSLVVIIHHLVVDTVSWRIILEDIDTLIGLSREGKSLVLPAKTASFMKWANALVEYQKGRSMQKAKAYWQKRYLEEDTRLRKDFPEGRNTTGDTKEQSVRLDAELSEALLKNANHAYGTKINELLIACLLTTLQKKFNTKRIKIDIESHGRESDLVGVDVGRTVGWFTTVFPAFFDVNDATQFGENILEVKESLRKIPNNGIDFGIMNFMSGNTPASKSSDILFNYFGQFDSDVNGLSFDVSAAPGNDVGKNHNRIYSLIVSAIFVNKQLQLTISYSGKQYKDEVISDLVNEFSLAAKQLSDHCLSVEKRYLSPSDFTYKELSNEKVQKLQASYSLQDVYPLSPMQEGLLFYKIRYPKSTIYSTQSGNRINGRFDYVSFEQSLGELIARHDSLRTIFLHDGFDRPLQLVLNNAQTYFQYFDLSKKSVEEKQKWIEAYYLKDKKAGFDLSKNSFRAAVVRLSSDEVELIFTFHHILMDGWCMDILLSELIDIYKNRVAGTVLSLPPAAQYGRYIEWLQEREQERTISFWKEYMNGSGQVASVPKHNDIDSVNKPTEGDHVDVSYTLKNELASSLKQTSGELGVTLNTIFQVGWGILLKKYNNIDDITFGTVVSGRPSEVSGSDSMIGLFVNTIPNRIVFDTQKTLHQTMLDYQHNMLACEQHQFMSLAEIQRYASPNRELFDHILVFENFPLTEAFKKESSKRKQLSSDFFVSNTTVTEQTHYDLAVVVVPGDEMTVNFKFDKSMISESVIKSMFIHFQNILEAIVSSPQNSVRDVDMLTAEEKQVLLNMPKTDEYKNAECENVITGFREAVKRFPDHVACTLGDQSITYRQLDEDSDAVAVGLMNNGVVSGSIVAIVMEKSIELISGIFGILKAGACYLPIDLAYPEDRKRYIISDSNCRFMLVNGSSEDASRYSCRVMDVNDLKLTKVGTSPNLNISAQSPAYIIYTSGTTGNPKGCVIEHRNVMTLLANTNFPLSDSDVWCLFHSQSFDYSVWEIFGALLTGGKLVITPRSITKNTDLLFDVFEREGLTILNQTPSSFTNLLSSGILKTKIMNTLRYVILSGEALNLRILEDCIKQFPNVKYINMYGITETTVFCTAIDVTMKEVEQGISNIGKVLPHFTVCILDKDRNLVPYGSIGELYFGGGGVGRGYLNRQDLNVARFIESPFVTGERLYKSGDLGKFLSNGDMLYLGRMDRQVKIRGHRIELGEIEEQISRHPQVIDCAVICRENSAGDKSLYAYVVSPESITFQEIRSFLETKLPVFMVPNYFIRIERIPLTNNGKVDVHQLPDFSYEPTELQVPSTAIQRKLAVVWAELLSIQLEVIHQQANFFDLGGHSLKVTQLISRINEEFGVRLPIADMFKKPTLEEMASLLELNQLAEDSSLVTTNHITELIID